MHTSHRRPLVAYGLVSAACAFVLAQPTLSTLAGGLPSPPVVRVLVENGQIVGNVFLPSAPAGEGPDRDGVGACRMRASSERMNGVR